MVGFYRDRPDPGASRYDSEVRGDGDQPSLRPLRQDIMADTTKSESSKIERRGFIKKTRTMAGAIAAGFPGIISAQTVTNTVKIGVVGCGGRGTGAAAQAL